MPSRSPAETSLSNLMVPPAARMRSCSFGSTRRGSTWPSVGKNSASRKRPSSDGSSSARLAASSRRWPSVIRAKRSKSLRSRGWATTSEPLKGVSGSSRRQMSSERRPSLEMIGSENFRLAIRREHAAGPMAGGIGHFGVTALVQGDRVAGLREQQGLPGARNACADDGYRGIRSFRRLQHPCPFAGITRIRFKGSPRSWAGRPI
ncbi:hypothetical protein ACVWW2_006871 [Bradyrhizobium sp. LM4.3]